MKTIRIHFADFASDFNAKDNEFINILKERYNVLLDNKTPEYVFYSSFGKRHLSYDCIRIFYTGECITPDFNFCDYAMAFDRISFGDRYLRLPLYRLFQYRKRYDLLFNRAKVYNVDSQKEFCNFVVSNCFANDIRVKMYQALSKYKKVNSGGRYMNNVGGPVPDKYEFQLKHKFSIAFENGVYDGYATEKIVDALAAGTIPIYMGDPNIHLDFNEKSFINGHRYRNLEEIVARVIELDSDDEQYLKVLNTNPIIYDLRNNDDLRAFLFNIFDQPITSAARRPYSRYSSETEAFIKRHLFFESKIYSKYLRLKKLLSRLFYKAF